MKRREKIGAERTTITFSLPIQLKKNLEQYILAKNLQNNKKESVSYFCFKAVNFYFNLLNAKNENEIKKLIEELENEKDS